jgi:hypothetical protein
MQYVDVKHPFSFYGDSRVRRSLLRGNISDDENNPAPSANLIPIARDGFGARGTGGRLQLRQVSLHLRRAVSAAGTGRARIHFTRIHRDRRNQGC